MENKQYLDKTLKYLLTNDGRYYTQTTDFLLEALTNEQFVIFYYILEMDKANVILTRELLELGMETNKMEWVDPRSRLMRDNTEITKEYLQSKTNTRLEYPADYANALEQVVLSTYDNIVNLETPSNSEFLAMLQQIKEVASASLTMKVIQELVPLLNGDKQFLYLDKVRYEKSDALHYLARRSQGLLHKVSSSDNTANSKHHIWEKIAQNGVQLVPTVIWNLGKTVFSNLQPGFITSIVAPPKVGKTRFCVGEITYPALLLGKNVKYYSGEMEEHILRSMLLTKHIKYMLGHKIPEARVQKIMITASRIRTGRATKKECIYFDKVPKNILESVTIAENDLFYSGKYGNLKVVHVGDVSSTDTEVIPGEFIVEQQHMLLKKELESMEEKDRWDVVIQDHVNHMRSEKGLKDTALLETYYQSAKALATSNDHKFLYVIVNHLNTEQERKIEENDSAEGLKLRGHGTNEGGKSADIELIMYQTSQDMKEGTIQMQCTADRFVNISEKFKTNQFKLSADRAYCDFTFEGANVKPPYPTVDQLGDIERAIMETT